MKTKLKSNLIIGLLVAAIATFTFGTTASAGLESDAHAAYHQLISESPAAANVAASAKGVLVFPKIVKGGFMIGAQHGDGVLFVHGHVAGHYKTVAASYGLQAGIQKFGYALFFMTDHDLAYLHKSGGWEIGTGPSVVIVDTGMAKTLTTTTLRKGVYAFAFSQRGLMGGLGLQGSKITEIHP
jgi:lipid-binding SYLF domain-containing protein